MGDVVGKEVAREPKSTEPGDIIVSVVAFPQIIMQ